MFVIETFVKRVHEENSTELAKWLSELADLLINQLDHKLNFLVGTSFSGREITYEFYISQYNKRSHCNSEYTLFNVKEYSNTSMFENSYSFSIKGDDTLYSISSFDTLKQKIEKEFETNHGWVRLVRSLLLKEED